MKVLFLRKNLFRSFGAYGNSFFRTVIFSTFIFLLFTDFDQVQAAGPLEALSQVAYKISGGESCDVITEEKAQKALTSLESECNSRNHSLADLTINMVDINERALQSSEDRFFVALSNQHSLELACAADFAKQVGEGEATANENINSYLSELRKHKQALTQSTLELTNNPSLTNKICPLQIDELSAPTEPSQKNIFNSNSQICRNIIQHRSAFQAISSTIPLSGTPSVQALINKYISFPDGAHFDGWKKSIGQEIQKAYRSAEKLLRQESEKLAYSAKDGGKSMDRSSRKALLSDPAVTEKVINSSSDKETMKAIACQADAYYGRGANELDVGLMIGSFVMSGVASVAVRGGAVAARVNSVAQSARVGGWISINSARALQVAALAMDSELALTQIDSDCFSKANPKIVELNSTQDAGQCVSAPTVGRLKADHCILMATLSVLSFGAVILPDLAKIGSKTLVSSPAASQTARQEISKLLNRDISEEQLHAIEKAHWVGANEKGQNGAPASLGNYTLPQIRKKNEILKKAGFNKDEVRLLMETGKVGLDESMALVSKNEMRQLFAQRYLKTDGGILPSQREFREAWADSEKWDRVIYEKRILSIPIDEKMVAARLISDNPNGTLTVELVNGQRRTVGSQDLPQVRFASEESTATFNQRRLERLSDSALIAEERKTQLKGIMSLHPDLKEEKIQLRRDWIKWEGNSKSSEMNLQAVQFLSEDSKRVHPGVISKVFNDGRIQVVTPDGKSKILTEAEMSSMEYSKQQPKDFFTSTVKLQEELNSSQSLKICSEISRVLK